VFHFDQVIATDIMAQINVILLLLLHILACTTVHITVKNCMHIA